MEQHIAQQKLGAIAPYLFSTLETQQKSFELGQYICENDVKGAVIECGLGAGANFASMMLGVLTKEDPTDRVFWGFDSFEGIQLAGAKDTEQAGIGAITHDVNVDPKELLVSSGITAYSKAEVVSYLHSWELSNAAQLHLVQGWVQNTIDKHMVKSIGDIAILRLDMDIYDPTMHTLKMLYNKVSKGGVVIIDDWALDGVKTACEEFFYKMKISPKLQTIENSTPVYWIK